MQVNEHYQVVDSWQGTFLVNCHDKTKGGLKDSQPEIAALLPYVKGFVVDIGANIGAHTVAFSPYADHVLSIEPYPMTYYQLCTNVLLNNCTNVSPLKIALGNTDGVAHMHTVDVTVAHASPGNEITLEGTPVLMKTLDSIGLQSCDFIKIDVEGYEEQVLLGAQNVLALHKPVVYVELHTIEMIRSCVSIMENLGYEWEHLVQTEICNDDGSKQDVPFYTYGYLFKEKSAA